MACVRDSSMAAAQPLSLVGVVLYSYPGGASGMFVSLQTHVPSGEA